MCHICNATDGGKHHYHCPFETGVKSIVVTEEEMKLKYKNSIKWRRQDGQYYIITNR